MNLTQDITAMDYFCGAGGSSNGMVKAGVRVKGAANHWPLAIDTHWTNHPNTDHYLDDLQQAHPSRFPRTTIAWFSPECTNHSLAKGKKRKNIGQLDLWNESGVDPAEERSRATMREVVEFTEYHRYEVVIVENVVDIRHWQFFDEWLTAMLNMGYHHKILYLNAQFFGVPQSRDRFYAVFWKKGNRAPNLDFRPLATCSQHGPVNAVQAFKKEQHWGRFGARRQYIYRCPQCGHEVMPPTVPAASVIDWSISSEKIGDRKKPLKPKTEQRILAGLRKFGRWPLVADLGHSHAKHEGKVHSAYEPLPTQTGQQRAAFVDPLILSYANQESPARSADDVLFAIATGYTPRLVQPPFLTSYYSREGDKGWPVSSLDAPIPVIPGDPRHAVVLPPFISVQRGDPNYAQNFSADEPLTTIVAAGQQHYLVQPPFIMSYHSNPTFSDVGEPMPTQMGINHHALIVPFVTSLNHSTVRNTPTDEVFRTIMPGVNPSLVTPPFLASVNYFDDRCISLDDVLPTQTGANKLALVMSYYGSNPVFSPVDFPMPTMRTVAHEALLTPEDILPECGFRMLVPRELKLGMSFPDSYVILGSQRDQVKQIGNAVCEEVAYWIVAQCVESLQ